MDTLIYILFFWCLYLTFQVRKLQSHFHHDKDSEISPPPEEVRKIEPHIITADRDVAALTPSFLSQLLQKLPKYETTTWVGVFFSIVGSIGVYQYAIEQGWYTPSTIGSYIGLGLASIIGLTISQRQNNPQTSALLESITYLFAGSGVFWIAHQFHHYSWIHTIGLNLALLLSTFRFIHSDFERFHLWGVFSVTLLLSWYVPTVPWAPLVILGRLTHRGYSIQLPLFIVLIEAITALSSSNMRDDFLEIGIFIAGAWLLTLYDLTKRHPLYIEYSMLIAPFGMVLGFIASLLLNTTTLPISILLSLIIPHLILPFITTWSRTIHIMVAAIASIFYVTLGFFWIESELAYIVSAISGTLLLVTLLGERIMPLLGAGWALGIIMTLFSYIHFYHYDAVFLTVAGSMTWILFRHNTLALMTTPLTPAFPLAWTHPDFQSDFFRAIFMTLTSVIVLMDVAPSWYTILFLMGILGTDGFQRARTLWPYWSNIMAAYLGHYDIISMDWSLMVMITILIGAFIRTQQIMFALSTAIIIHLVLWDNAGWFHMFTLPEYFITPLTMVSIILGGVVWLQRKHHKIHIALPISFVLVSTLYWIAPFITPWGFLGTLYAIAYLKEYVHVTDIWNKGLIAISLKTLFFDGIDILPLWHYSECALVGIILILLAKQRQP